MAARIRCDRYESGKLGVIIYNYGAYVNEVTDGFDTVTNIYTTSSASGLFIGSANSANLDGYVDTPVAIISTYFTTAPTLDQFTQLYNQYVAIKKGI